MGEQVFEPIQYAKKSCIFCREFESYAHAYFDEQEPEDMGFCCLGMYDGHTDATKTCPKFKG